MRAYLLCFAGLTLLAGCQTVEQQQQQEMTQASAAAGEELVAMPADAQTRAKAHVDLAGAYYTLGNLAVALEETRIAVAANPNYAPAYNIQGLVRMDLRDPAGAEESFKRGLQLAPQDPDLNHNYGWFLCQTNRAEQSAQWFLNAVKNPLYRTPARSYAAAGRCTEHSNPKEAADYFERALRLEPNNAGTLLPYADLQYRQGNAGEARALLTRYNALVPDPTAEALWLALRVERKLGDNAAAQSYAAQLRRRFASSPQYQAMQRGQFD
jgi:type IV pilus biogenesis/stability protein PilW